jgi:hypothetical protein
VISNEMIELNAACEARDDAYLTTVRIRGELREAELKLDVARARVHTAHDAMERAARLEAAAARIARSKRDTLSDADEVLPRGDTIPEPVPDWLAGPSDYAPDDKTPIAVKLTPTGCAVADAMAAVYPVIPLNKI